MTDAFISAALRTPVGRHGGSLAGVRPDDLAAIPIKAVVERSGIDPASIDDVIFGCANQAGEDNRNVARMALLLAGLPVEVPGQTVNRLCGSGLQAVASAAQAIKASEGEIFIAGGVESMTRAPYVMLKSGEPWSRKAPEAADTTVGWRFVNPRMKKEWTISLGETAEVVAARYKISRAEQDAFAVESQQRAERALKACVFTNELVPVQLADGSTFAKDEYPRAGTTMDAVSKLKPAFRKDGTVTAASSSGINDGAAALLVTAGRPDGPTAGKPLARIVASAVAGDVGFIVESAVDARNASLIALPGGRTPQPIFGALAAKVAWEGQDRRVLMRLAQAPCPANHRLLQRAEHHGFVLAG